jgi:hypothetical protein
MVWREDLSLLSRRAGYQSTSSRATHRLLRRGAAHRSLAVVPASRARRTRQGLSLLSRRAGLSGLTALLSLLSRRAGVCGCCFAQQPTLSLLSRRAGLLLMVRCSLAVVPASRVGGCCPRHDPNGGPLSLLSRRAGLVIVISSRFRHTIAVVDPTRYPRHVLYHVVRQ